MSRAAVWAVTMGAAGSALIKRSAAEFARMGDAFSRQVCTSASTRSPNDAASAAARAAAAAKMLTHSDIPRWASASPGDPTWR
jgi:hypothetical protein